MSILLRRSLPSRQKEQLLGQLWHEMIAIKKERNVLSTKTSAVVEDAYQNILVNEGSAAAEEFLNGRLAASSLKAHYNAITELSSQAISLYDRIQHVEQTGVLPTEVHGGATKDKNIDALKHECYRLKDFIYKKRKNLKTKTPKNPSRIQIWKEELARAEAHRDDLVRRIKQLHYESRG